MSKLFIALIQMYQKFISPLFPPSCRFYPTCSHYSIDAYRKYGLFRGTIKSAWRILRCNPWNKGGHDPLV